MAIVPARVFMPAIRTSSLCESSTSATMPRRISPEIPFFLGGGAELVGDLIGSVGLNKLFDPWVLNFKTV
ncbi:MAG TPA: hypothetical protein DD423_07330 [Opitutae bacterium]|nr:hypothetical protein [Opitutae bacterium]